MAYMGERFSAAQMRDPVKIIITNITLIQICGTCLKTSPVFIKGAHVRLLVNMQLELRGVEYTC